MCPYTHRHTNKPTKYEETTWIQSAKEIQFFINTAFLNQFLRLYHIWPGLVDAEDEHGLLSQIQTDNCRLSRRNTRFSWSPWQWSPKAFWLGEGFFYRTDPSVTYRIDLLTHAHPPANISDFESESCQSVGIFKENSFWWGLWISWRRFFLASMRWGRICGLE